MKLGALAVTIAVSLAFPALAQQAAPKVLKMQSSWPAGIEVLDATNKKVIDGFHSIPYYWVNKNRAAVLFAGPPGGPFGMDHTDYLGWMWEGGGHDLWI